jgi:peroxiredoxin Q/BCP
MSVRLLVSVMSAVMVLSSIGAAGVLGDDGKAGPQVGEKAPDFKLPYATQEQVKYNPAEGMGPAQYRGKIVVLAFYPADWSPGCTTELCTFRDTFKDLDQLGAIILGISGDYAFSHHEWAKHHGLNFPLLSDHDHQVAKTYASYDPQWGYNKRTVYVLDGEGVVRYRNLDFKHGDKSHYDELRGAINKLKGK